MAYSDGEPLGSRLKRRGQLSPEEGRRILMETADALGAAHALGIIHRDVKPDNILLEGSRGRVMVTDFGIAKALSSTTGSGTLTATRVPRGPPPAPRAAPAYPPRPPSTACARPRAFGGRPRVRARPAGRSPDPGPPARRPRRDAAQRGAPKTNEPKIVQDARSSFVKWASVCGPLLVLNMATGNHIPSWSLMVGGIWMAFGLVPKYVRLWHAGYSWRDVLSRPPAPDAIEARLSPAGGVRPRDLPAASATNSVRTCPTCSKRAATAR